MAKKQMKIEDLAVMIKKGFDSTATKAELQELRKETLEGFRIMGDDIRDIKITLGPLVRMVAALDSEVVSLKNRVARLERKAGIGRLG